MRLFVFLLVLANLLFFAWTRGILGTGGSDALRAGEPLRAGQIRLLSNDQPPEESRARENKAPPPAEPAAPTESAPAESVSTEPTQEEVCIALNDVPQAEADALERLFAEKLPAFRLLRTAMPGNSSYWVRISPSRTRREAEDKVEELKKLGVRDYFIMQEGGTDSFAISLGLFSRQEAAESTLAALKRKGVQSVGLVERPRKSALARIEFHGPEAQAGEMRQALGEVLPQAKSGACGHGAAQ